MRRAVAVFVVVAVFAPASFAAVARFDAARCAMACHADGSAAGASCCLVGGGADGPVFKTCTQSRDGVPLPPTCRLASPRAADVLPAPLLAGRADVSTPMRPISRSHEPADPVPLLFS